MSIDMFSTTTIGEKTTGLPFKIFVFQKAISPHPVILVEISKDKNVNIPIENYVDFDEMKYFGKFINIKKFLEKIKKFY